MEAAVGAGQYRQAEQARLEAYAFFEFGPERRLRSFDPGLALDIEGLIWFGTAGQRRASPSRSPSARRGARSARRGSRSTRSSPTPPRRSATPPTRPRSSPTARSSSSARGWRACSSSPRSPPRWSACAAGCGARCSSARSPACVVSIVTWVLAQTMLRSLEQYGEKLEAVVGLMAIGVLLLITNWFFHKVYWSEWIAKFHRQRKRYEKLEKTRVHLRAGDRAVRARPDERLPRGLRDGAVPAVARSSRRAPRPCSRAPASAWR